MHLIDREYRLSPEVDIVLVAGAPERIRERVLVALFAERIPLIVIEPDRIERAMLAAEASLKCFENIRREIAHPRYRNEAPRSPRPGFRKRR